MKLRYRKMKMEDSYNIIRNNNLAILSVCVNGKPLCIPIYYDTDCFCGNLKLYFEACKCGEIMDNIYEGDIACVSIMTNYSNSINVVRMEGTINILPSEVDCCCKPIDKCTINLEFIPCKIIGKRYTRC